MKRIPLPLLAVLAVGAVASLAAAVAWDRAHVPTTPPELVPLWSEATAHLEKGEAEGAKKSLVQWLEGADASGIRSPEARYNLAIAHWTLKEPAQTTHRLLESLSLTRALADIGRIHAALAAIQRELGVSDGLLREWHFRFRYWLTENGVAFLAMMGFWSLVAALLLLAKRGDSMRWPERVGAIVVPSLFLSLASLGLWSRDWRSCYAVLDAGDSAVGLFPNPRLDTQEKLLDLPSGTLVHTTGETQNGFSKVDRPLIAWVPSTQLLLPFSSGATRSTSSEEIP